MPEPPGEHLPVVGEDLLRHPVPAQRRGQPVTPRPVSFGRHQRRTDAEPGVVIQPSVSALAVDPSVSPIPPTASICHSSIGAPRSQRRHVSRRRWRAPRSMSAARINAR